MQLEGKDDKYIILKKEYQQKSVEVLPENCTEFITDFLDFFNDGHLIVFERPNHSYSEITGYRKRIKGSKLSKDSLYQLRQSVNKNLYGNPSDIIEGIWTDGKSKLIIVKSENVYKAYISESTEEGSRSGELKAIFRPKDKGYSCTYYSYKYSPSFIKGDVYKDGQLLVMGHIFWKRVDASLNLMSNALTRLNHPTTTVLNENSTLLTIPTFNIDYQIFSNFIKENKVLIKNSTNLIIDVRGNRGGNGIYFPLIEFYATQNMEGGQGLVLASKDNLTYFERQMNYSKKIYAPVVQRMTDKFGNIVDGPLYPGKKFTIGKSKIKNVAILTDKACASATESFIIHSKRASSKVKTFGSATDGVIDFTSVNSLPLNSGKQYIYFGYPTSTLHKEIPKNGYNETGIIPDVHIKSKEVDKIKFILNYFKE